MVTKMIFIVMIGILLEFAMAGNPIKPSGSIVNPPRNPISGEDLKRAADTQWHGFLCDILTNTAKLRTSTPSESLTIYMKNICVDFPMLPNSTTPQHQTSDKKVDINKEIVSGILLKILEEKPSDNSTPTIVDPIITEPPKGKTFSEFTTEFRHLFDMIRKSQVIITVEPIEQTTTATSKQPITILTDKPDENKEPLENTPPDESAKNSSGVATVCANAVYGLNLTYTKMIDDFKTIIKQSRIDYAFMGQRKYGYNTTKSTIWKHQGAIKEIVEYNLDTTNLNGNGAFNPQTGFFTAPVEGIFHFNFHGVGYGVKDDISKTTIMVVTILKMDQTKHHPIALAEGRIEAYKNQGDLHQISVQATVKLHKGEAVGVQLEKGWIFEDVDHTTSFSGRLLQYLKKL